MKTVHRILGETRPRALTPYQEKIHKDPLRAYEWALSHGQRFPEAEPYIAKDPYYALVYAAHVLRRRWPEAEAVIASDMDEAYWYAKHVIKGRWKEAEATILKSPYKEDYLKLFPEAVDDNVLNGNLDWLD